MVGCDFSNLPDECYSKTLYKDDYDLYKQCYALAGCNGVQAKRPMYDMFTWRRK